MSGPVVSLARELDALRARLAGVDNAALDELIGSLRSTVEELRLTEEELSRQKEELSELHEEIATEADRYRTIFDSAPVAYVTTDPTGKIVDANAAASAVFSIDRRFLLGKPLSVFVEAGAQREFRTQTSRLLRVGGILDVHVRMRRRLGVPFDALLRAAARRDSVFWVVQDVTEKRQAEERRWELNRELEARVDEQAGQLQAVLEQLPIGVWIVDRSGALVRANRRAQEIASAGAGPIALPVARALAGETVAGERVVFGELTLSANAGPVRDERGAIVAAVVTLEDVTERERREQADRDFVANAAHQLRTPLTAIASSVAALQGGAKDEPADRERFLTHLERETERMTRLTRALLALARLQRGEEPPQVSVVPLRPLLDTLCAVYVAHDRVRLELECADDVGVIANPELLEEAIANVLANALAYTDEGRVAVAASSADGKVAIEVADTGPGMGESERRRAFERFYRADRSRGGSGLGLPIAKAAIEAVGGTIALGSRAGAGTTVRMTLPLARIVR